MVEFFAAAGAAGAVLDVGAGDGIDGAGDGLSDLGHGIAEADGCFMVSAGWALHANATWSPEAVGLDPSRAD